MSARIMNKHLITASFKHLADALEFKFGKHVADAARRAYEGTGPEACASDVIAREREPKDASAARDHSISPWDVPGPYDRSRE